MKVVIFIFMAKKSGFTLVECVIALGILLALTAAVLPVGNNYFSLGRNSAAKSGIANIAAAISQYHFEMGELPANLKDLTTAHEQYGPYLNEDGLKDPWDQNYNYATSDRTFAVWSNGPDKKNNSGGGVPISFQGDDVGVIGH